MFSFLGLPCATSRASAYFDTILQVASSAWTPVAGAFERVRGTKILESVRQGAQFVQEELSGSGRRKPRKRLTPEEVEEREKAKGEAAKVLLFDSDACDQNGEVKMFDKEWWKVRVAWLPLSLTDFDSGIRMVRSLCF